ncbi:hypothetical protein [Coxiella-like endosymbiont]|uniref:hypothetical protein n=1 Tax=Coxiella-like endosymbiont TaxID=1592897 RepID=UPI00272BDE42|nr:hypothetical protein [Coxiella-like endosymbiont]
MDFSHLDREYSIDSVKKIPPPYRKILYKYVYINAEGGVHTLLGFWALHELTMPVNLNVRGVGLEIEVATRDISERVKR